jgi:hypothetical protein
MDVRTDRRRQVRELVGWGILSTVVTLSRLLVWVDRALDGGAEALNGNAEDEAS